MTGMFYQWLLMERHPGSVPDMISIVFYFSMLTLNRMKVWDFLTVPIYMFYAGRSRENVGLRLQKDGF